MQKTTPPNADDNFAHMQAEMTRKWYDGLKRRGVDVESYVVSRQKSYIKRWKEALVHVGTQKKILDIGGGFSYDDLLELLTEHKIDYHYIDIDRVATDATAKLAEKFGYRRDRFITGFNSSIPFPDLCFDAIFSSHSLEHSDDIYKTFQEIRRVLKPDGIFVFAVPIGWDPSIREHPYFFSADEWICLTKSFGFDVLNVHVGKTYPEQGYDLMLVSTEKRR